MKALQGLISVICVLGILMLVVLSFYADYEEERRLREQFEIPSIMEPYYNERFDPPADDTTG